MKNIRNGITRPRQQNAVQNKTQETMEEYTGVLCPKCLAKNKKILMISGIAIKETYDGIPDFIGGEVMTMSASGGGGVCYCLKCPRCGHSIKE